MADIKALAASAKNKLDKGDAIFEIDAIHKAIIGIGITNKNDLERLKPEVGRVFARNKHRMPRSRVAAHKWKGRDVMDKGRPRATKHELRVAMDYGRFKYPQYALPTDDLKLDVVMLHLMDIEIGKRREALDREAEERVKAKLPPKKPPNLALLVATTIRDLFGYKQRRRKLSSEEEERVREIEGLIKAYEGLMMKIFAMRRKYQQERPKAAKFPDPRNESRIMHASGQFRLT